MSEAITIPADERLTSFVNLMDVVGLFYRANPANPPKHMDISREGVSDLFQSLNHHEVRYLLVGGMATAMHGHIRATEDMDLWIRVGEPNKQNLIAALLENSVAGAPSLKDVPLLFGRTRPGWTSLVAGKRGFILDMGHSLRAFSDEDFDACYARALNASFDGVPFKVIHLNDLIAEKQATGRLKDLSDVEELTKLRTDSNADNL